VDLQSICENETDRNGAALCALRESGRDASAVLSKLALLLAVADASTHLLAAGL